MGDKIFRNIQGTTDPTYFVIESCNPIPLSLEDPLGFQNHQLLTI